MALRIKKHGNIKAIQAFIQNVLKAVFFYFVKTHVIF